MRSMKANIVVPLTQELYDWLGSKEREGYKRTPFMRYVIEQYMAAEKDGKTSLLSTAKIFWDAERITVEPQ